MNREIKFRAWDGNTMYHNHSVVMQIDGTVTFLDSDAEWKADTEGKIQLMQFTGLKDKNGVEIYEGDIVEAWSQGFKGVFEIKWRQSANPCWILYPAWQNREFWYISATEHTKGKQFISVAGEISTTDKVGYYDDGICIIGNIHQNPKLLPQPLN